MLILLFWNTTSGGPVLSLVPIVSDQVTFYYLRTDTSNEYVQKDVFNSQVQQDKIEFSQP